MASRYAALVEKLIARQREGRLDWSETETPGVYQVSFPEYGLRIFKRRGPDGTADVVISIHDASGSEIDEFTDVSVKDEISKAYYEMDELYSAARRTALGVEQALDTILSALDDAEPRPR